MIMYVDTAVMGDMIRSMVDGGLTSEQATRAFMNGLDVAANEIKAVVHADEAMAMLNGEL